MTRKELTRNYWRYYRMIEDKFRETIDYVEIATTNFFTYSNEFAMLLQSIGSELDNVFKVYCGFNPTERVFVK
jgi:chemotaxis methyl-accepting protein methylase